jgi:hypothetical protein
MNEEKLKLVVQLVSGLLASGHYTDFVEHSDGDKEPYILKTDNGKDWKTSGFNQRRSAIVVDAAFELLHEIDLEVNITYSPELFTQTPS